MLLYQRILDIKGDDFTSILLVGSKCDLENERVVTRQGGISRLSLPKT
jgi:GTPase SAR1 family protein